MEQLFVSVDGVTDVAAAPLEESLTPLDEFYGMVSEQFAAVSFAQTSKFSMSSSFFLVLYKRLVRLTNKAHCIKGL